METEIELESSSIGIESSRHNSQGANLSSQKGKPPEHSQHSHPLGSHFNHFNLWSHKQKTKWAESQPATTSFSLYVWIALGRAFASSSLVRGTPNIKNKLTNLKKLTWV